MTHTGDTIARSPHTGLPRIRIQSIDPPGTLVYVGLGDGIAEPRAEGGWDVIARPKWVGFTDWTGFEPYRMTIPIVFDALHSDVPIEVLIEKLRQLMRPARTPRDHTPIIRITGPVPHTSFNWVITGLEFTGEVRRESDGQRVRAFVNLSLLQYLPGDVLLSTTRTPAARVREEDSARSTQARRTTRTHTVRRGDTLWEIAAKKLGKGARWTEIAKLNNVRDPRKLRVGQVLRLP